MYELSGKRVFVAGHRGLVGGAIARRLAREGCEILTATRSEVDLRDQAAVRHWMAEQRPQAVFLAAAKVGGILANATYPADFLYDNLMIEANVIEAAHREDVEKLLFLGSSCIYPKFAEQPIVEEALLTGSLEPTNEYYAVAKIAGIKLCQAYRTQHGRDFISAMPTNLYGPGDNFDLQSSRATEMVIWGTGSPRREFLYVDDLADACVFLMKGYSDHQHINVGSGEDIPIYDLTRLVCEVVGFEGKIVKDPSKPDGTPRKLMSADRLRSMGWKPQMALREGIAATYAWFLEHHA